MAIKAAEVETAIDNSQKARQLNEIMLRMNAHAVASYHKSQVMPANQRRINKVGVLRVMRRITRLGSPHCTKRHEFKYFLNLLQKQAA